MKFVFTLVLFLSSVAAISAQATKVGVVDPNTVIQQSKKGKAFFTAHQAFITQKRNELNKDAEAIRHQTERPAGDRFDNERRK